MQNNYSDTKSVCNKFHISQFGMQHLIWKCLKIKASVLSPKRQINEETKLKFYKAMAVSHFHIKMKHAKNIKFLTEPRSILV
jgi:hypothetical protein